MTDSEIVYDVLVIGGGQAGLAAGYHLARKGLRFLILDASQRIGDSWRLRYDSLTLFTPRRFSQLPGLALTGDEEGYASKDEFADYLEAYAKAFALPVRSSKHVRTLRRQGEQFSIETASGDRFAAANVIVASGAFQAPAIPAISQQFDGVMQLSTNDYRNAAQLPEGPALIVGDGASGRDIAAELTATRKTYLAGGRPRRLAPERLLGISIWSWLNMLGLMKASPNSFFGGIMRRKDPFPDRNRNNAVLKKMGVTLPGRLTSATGRTAQFASGLTIEVAAVVWATGYRDDNAWLDIPEARDAAGSIRQTDGKSPVSGLYFVGRPWQRNRASALIMGAGADAEIVVTDISSRAR